MKRYRDCILHCIKGQSSLKLLKSFSDFLKNNNYSEVNIESKKRGSTLVVNVCFSELPGSRVVMWADCEEDNVKVCNIVPLPNSGVSELLEDEYNAILDMFVKDAIKPFALSIGSNYDTNTGDYEIEDIIPISFQKLDFWLSRCPLSAHPCDTNRWYDFVISLYENNEVICSSDFEEYLRNHTDWEDKTIHQFGLELESELNLLKYYGKH